MRQRRGATGGDEAVVRLGVGSRTAKIGPIQFFRGSLGDGHSQSRRQIGGVGKEFAAARAGA